MFALFSFLKGWKTLTAAGLVTLFGTLQYADIVSVIGDKYAGVGYAAIGLLMAFLRLSTNTSVGKK